MVALVIAARFAAFVYAAYHGARSRFWPTSAVLVSLFLVVLVPAASVLGWMDLTSVSGLGWLAPLFSAAVCSFASRATFAEADRELQGSNCAEHLSAAAFALVGNATFDAAVFVLWVLGWILVERSRS